MLRLQPRKSKLKSKEVLKHPKGSVFEEGYGQIPKLVMCDKELSVTAKAIYAYIASYAGGGNQAFPGTVRICADLNISRDTFQKHFKQIEDAGYITRTQIIAEGNRFANNVYEIKHIITRQQSKQNHNTIPF